MKANVDELKANPNISSLHYSQVIFRTGYQHELLQEESNLRVNINEIEALLLLHLEVMQNHMKISKDLIATLSLSIVDHMIDLVARLMIKK